MSIALCLLTWNELEGCKHDLPQLPTEKFDQVFAIDNGSTDGTVELLESFNIPVIRQRFSTYNGAYLSAFSACECEYLVFYHPKGSIKPSDCLRFREYFEQGYDLVIGSRLVAEGGHNEEDDQCIKARKWFVVAIAILSALLWKKSGPVIWDVLHGFRGYRKSAFIAMNTRQRGVSVDLESVARAYKKGMRCVEFPVHESPRLHGATHFKAIPAGWQILKYFWFEMGRE